MMMMMMNYNEDMWLYAKKMMKFTNRLAEMEAPIDEKTGINEIIASVNRYYGTVITGIEAWDDERLTIDSLNAKFIEEWN
jgi:hypothetical protein